MEAKRGCVGEDNRVGIMLLNKMPIHLYMLGALIKNRVIDNLDGFLIVTIQMCSRELHTYFFKKNVEPYNLIVTGGHDYVLCFKARLVDNILLLDSPRNKGVPKKNILFNSRATSSMISSLVNIRVCLKL